MAALHSGTLTGLPPVNECRGDPYLNKSWGVEESATLTAPDGKVYDKPLFSFDLDGETVVLFRHPMLYVGTDVTAWFDSYDAVNNNFFVKGAYEDQTPLWMDCYRIYSKYYNRFYKKVMKDGQ